MKEKAPDVLDIFTTIAAPSVKLNGKQIPPICTAYVLLMNTNNSSEKEYSDSWSRSYNTKGVFHSVSN